jgi:hypothetical protein
MGAIWRDAVGSGCLWKQSDVVTFCSVIDAPHSYRDDNDVDCREHLILSFIRCTLDLLYIHLDWSNITGRVK